MSPEECEFGVGGEICNTYTKNKPPHKGLLYAEICKKYAKGKFRAYCEACPIRPNSGQVWPNFDRGQDSRISCIVPRPIRLRAILPALFEYFFTIPAARNGREERERATAARAIPGCPTSMRRCQGQRWHRRFEASRPTAAKSPGGERTLATPMAPNRGQRMDTGPEAKRNDSCRAVRAPHALPYAADDPCGGAPATQWAPCTWHSLRNPNAQSIDAPRSRPPPGRSPRPSPRARPASRTRTSAGGAPRARAGGATKGIAGSPRLGPHLCRDEPTTLAAVRPNVAMEASGGAGDGTEVGQEEFITPPSHVWVCLGGSPFQDVDGDRPWQARSPKNRKSTRK